MINEQSSRWKHTYTATWVFREVFQQARLKLRLRPLAPAVVTSHVLYVDPQPARIETCRDASGNPVTLVEISTSSSQLNVCVDNVFEMSARRHGTTAEQARPWEEIAVRIGPSNGRIALTPSSGEALEDSDGLGSPSYGIDGLGSPSYARVGGALTRCSDEAPEICESALRSFSPGRPWLEAALDLADRVRQIMTYDSGGASESRTALKIFQSGRGTCQDFADVLLACLRSVGISSACVQGLLLEHAAPATDRSHAWERLFDQAGSWTDLDPLSARVRERGMVLAVGPDSMNARPLEGEIQGGGTPVLTVTNWVERVG